MVEWIVYHRIPNILSLYKILASLDVSTSCTVSAVIDQLWQVVLIFYCVWNLNALVFLVVKLVWDLQHFGKILVGFLMHVSYCNIVLELEQAEQDQDLVLLSHQFKAAAMELIAVLEQVKCFYYEGLSPPWYDFCCTWKLKYKAAAIWKLYLEYRPPFCLLSFCFLKDKIFLKSKVIFVFVALDVCFLTLFCDIFY